MKIDLNKRYGATTVYLKDDKPKEEQTLTCDIKQENNKIIIEFSSDCGKFGTDEMLDGYILTAERLMKILQEREDITDDEI